jgi:hypothetical protein
LDGRWRRIGRCWAPPGRTSTNTWPEPYLKKKNKNLWPPKWTIVFSRQLDSLLFWTVQRIYRSSPHLREADDFAGDVTRVPSDRDFPHNIRQNANHADA